MRITTSVILTGTILRSKQPQTQKAKLDYRLRENDENKYKRKQYVNFNKKWNNRI